MRRMGRVVRVERSMFERGCEGGCQEQARGGEGMLSSATRCGARHAARASDRKERGMNMDRMWQRWKRG